MADKDFQTDDDIIDLTELIESGNEAPKAAKTAAASYERAMQPSSTDHSDFESLLAETEAHDKRETTPHVVDPNEELDMSSMGDIDNLLESLDIPMQPRESAPTPAAAPPREPTAADLGFSDLDSVLDDLLGDAPSSNKPESKEAPKEEIIDDAEQAPELADLDADLDNILSSIDTPEPKSEAKAIEEPAAVDELDIGIELDSMLEDQKNEVHKSPQTFSSPAPEENDFDLPADLDAMLDEADSKQQTEPVIVPKMPDSEPDVHESALSEIYASNEQPSASDPYPITHPAANQSYPADLVTGICRNLLGNQNGIQENLQNISHQLGAQSANIENLAHQYDELNKRLLDCESKLTSTRTRVAALENSNSKIASIEELLRDGAPLHIGFKELIATAVAKALENFAPAMPGESALSKDLEERIKKLESENSATAELLNSLEQRISTEPGGQDFSGKLNELESGGIEIAERLSSLDQRFTALEANNDLHNELNEKLHQVENEDAAICERLNLLEQNIIKVTQDVADEQSLLESSEIEMTERLSMLDQRLAALENDTKKQLQTSDNDLDSRLNALESKFANLETNFNTLVEKSAASAVARILQEEITRLVEGG